MYTFGSTNRVCTHDKFIHYESKTKVVSSSPTQPGILDTTLCDKACQWLTNWRSYTIIAKQIIVHTEN